MSYIVTQMVRGKPYAYDAEAYWDPVKKQPRQRKRYLGGIDADGNIVPKTSQREVTLSKTFEPSYPLAELAGQAGLLERLQGAFGQDAPAALAPAVMRVSSSASLRGHLFVLRSLVLERASGAKLLGKYWIDDMLLELVKLKATRIGGDWRLSEMTRKQRELLLKLEVPLPQDSLVNTNAGD